MSPGEDGEAARSEGQGAAPGTVYGCVFVKRLGKTQQVLEQWKRSTKLYDLQGAAGLRSLSMQVREATRYVGVRGLRGYTGQRVAPAP